MSAAGLIDRLRARGAWVATAESCSGGLLAAAFTDIAGASDVFGYGVVTYSNQAKMQLLQVGKETLARYGAVSEETAREMASGLLALSGADLALATTGIAGPGGGSAEKPVGLVYIAAGGRERILVRRCLFAGERDAVRRQTVAAALALAEEYLKQTEQGE